MIDWECVADEVLRLLGVETVAHAETRVGPVDVFEESQRRAYVECLEGDADGLEALLAHPVNRVVVKLLANSTRAVPEALFGSIVRAGALTWNPSFNKHYIWPCAIVYGRARVMRQLIELLAAGTPAEKVGVPGAVYWCSMAREHMFWPADVNKPIGMLPPDEPITRQVEQFEDESLRQFLATSDLDLQRSLVAYAIKPRDRNPSDVKRAIERAQSSEDEYIRQRLAYDFGSTPPEPLLRLANTDVVGDAHQAHLATTAVRVSFVLDALESGLAREFYVQTVPPELVFASTEFRQPATALNLP